MNRYKIILIVLSLVTLSCSMQVGSTPPQPTLTLTPISSPTKPSKTPLPTHPPTVANAQTAEVVMPIVNVRQSPNGVVIGYVTVGNSVQIVSCSESWCQVVEPAGYIWRGCLSDNPEGLECRSK